MYICIFYDRFRIAIIDARMRNNAYFGHAHDVSGPSPSSSVRTNWFSNDGKPLLCAADAAHTMG